MRISVPTSNTTTDAAFNAQFNILTDSDLKKFLGFFEGFQKMEIKTISDLKEQCKNFLFENSKTNRINGHVKWEEEFSFIGYKEMLVNFRKEDDLFILKTKFRDIETVLTFKYHEECKMFIYTDPNKIMPICLWDRPLEVAVSIFVTNHAHQLGVPLIEIEEFKFSWLNKEIRVGRRKANIFISYMDCISEIMYKWHGKDSNQTIIGLGHECSKWQNVMPIISLKEITSPMNIHLSVAITDWSGHKKTKKSNDDGEMINTTILYNPENADEFWKELGNILNGNGVVSSNPKDVVWDKHSDVGEIV